MIRRITTQKYILLLRAPDKKYPAAIGKAEGYFVLHLNHGSERKKKEHVRIETQYHRSHSTPRTTTGNGYADTSGSRDGIPRIPNPCQRHRTGYRLRYGKQEVWNQRGYPAQSFKRPVMGVALFAVAVASVVKKVLQRVYKNHRFAITITVLFIGGLIIALAVALFEKLSLFPVLLLFRL